MSNVRTRRYRPVPCALVAALVASLVPHRAAHAGSSWRSVLVLSLGVVLTVLPDAVAGQAPVGEIQGASMSGFIENAPSRTVKSGHPSAPSLLTTEEVLLCTTLLAEPAAPAQSRIPDPNGAANAGAPSAIEACRLTEQWYDVGPLGSVTVLCDYSGCGQNGVAAGDSHSFVY